MSEEQLYDLYIDYWHTFRVCEL